MATTSNFNKYYFAYGISTLVIAVAAGFWGAPLISGNTEARSVIVTVFSILAGFLIAVMTLYGNPAIMTGSWRKDQLKKNRIRVRLIRQKYLFYLYLLTLTVVFITTLTCKIWPSVTQYLERVYFGLSVWAFFLSFRLPSSLMEAQMGVLDAIVGTKRNKTKPLDR